MLFYYLSIAFLSLLLLLGYSPQNRVKIAQFQPNLVSLQADYKLQHSKIMAAIRAEFGISEQVWDRYMSDFKELVANDNLLKVKQEKGVSNKLTIRLLEEYGINPTVVKIEYTDKVSQAESLQDVVDNRLVHKLSINPTWFKTFNVDKQEAILRHEIQHLLHYDCIEEMYIRWILTDLGFTKKDWEQSPAMIAYYHMRELRADAFACAKSKKVAQSLHDYFCSCITSDESTQVWDSHPSDSYRAQCLAIMHNLPSSVIA